MSWLFTTIQHQPRLDMGLNINEYCVLDLYYQSQVSPIHSVEGWAQNSYQQVSSFLGISKGSIHKMVGRLVGQGLMEVNPANPAQKRTTKYWYASAYERVLSENGPGAGVLSENGKRSLRERHIEERNIKHNGRKEGDFQKNLNQPVSAEEIDLAFDAPNTFKKSSAKKSFQRGGEAGPSPEPQARVVAMKAELGGIASAPKIKPEPTPIDLEDATKRVMAEIETPDGQRKLNFAQGRAGIKKLPNNIFAAVARYVEHCAEKGYPLSNNPIYKLGGYLKYQATKEANQADTAIKSQANKTNNNATRFQPTDNPSQYDYSKITGW